MAAPTMPSKTGPSPAPNRGPRPVPLALPARYWARAQNRRNQRHRRRRGSNAARQACWAAQPWRGRLAPGICVLTALFAGATAAFHLVGALLGAHLAAANWWAFGATLSLVGPPLMLRRAVDAAAIAVAPAAGPMSFRPQAAVRTEGARNLVRGFGTGTALSLLYLVAASAVVLPVGDPTGPLDTTPLPTPLQLTQFMAVIIVAGGYGIAASHLASVLDLYANAGLGPQPVWVRAWKQIGRGRRASITALRLARRAVWPLVDDPHGPAPPAEWAEDIMSWNVAIHLRQLAVAFFGLAGGLFVLFVGVSVAGAARDPAGATATAALFCLLSAVIALGLRRTVGVVVTAAPDPNPPSGHWRDSRERAYAVARVYSDAHTFVLFWTVLGCAPVLVFGGGMALSLVGNLRHDPDSTSRVLDALLEVGLAPFWPLVLSALTLGSIALVTNAYKEVRVLRAEIVYRERKTRDRRPRLVGVGQPGRPRRSRRVAGSARDLQILVAHPAASPTVPTRQGCPKGTQITLKASAAGRD